MSHIHEGALVIVNTGGPDLLGVVVQTHHWNRTNPWLKEAILVRLTSRHHWVPRVEVRRATADDLRQVAGHTCSAWQLALWRALHAAGATPFSSSDIPALTDFWAAGWPVEAVVHHLASPTTHATSLLNG